MISPIEQSVERIARSARGRYHTIVEDAREQATQAAGRVSKGKRPVKALARAGVGLSGITHRATRDVLRAQTRLVEHQLDSLAGRLRLAARAGSLRGLIAEQIRLVPDTAALLVSDGRHTLDAVAAAGGEVKNLLAGTVQDLRSDFSARPKRKKAANKSAGVRRKAASKTAGKPARKKAAAKVKPRRISEDS